jgi:hypothetical protein
MPTIRINGGDPVPVDSSFFKLPKDEQERRVDAYVAGNPAALQSLDPAQIPSKELPQSFDETLTGMVGSGLYGVPVAGPALLGAGARLGAAGQALTGKQPYSQALEDIQTKQEQFRRNNPVLAGSAEAGGATLATMGAGSTGAGARALGITGASLPIRSATSALTGGTIGGLDALARGNDPVTGVEVGATFGALAPAAGQAAGSGVRSVFGRKAVAAPALEDIRNSSSAAFQRMDNSGVALRPAKVNRMLDDIVQTATKSNLDRYMHPDTYKAFNEAISYRFQRPTLSDLHQLRQKLQDATGAALPRDRQKAALLLNKLNEHIDSLNALDVTGPDPRAAVASLQQGIAEWHRMRKGETIAKLFENANDAKGDYQEALRGEFRKLKKNDKQMRGFTPEERAAIAKVVRGGSVENVFRFFGAFAPTASGGPIRNMASLVPSIAATHQLGWELAAPLAVGTVGAQTAAKQMNLRSATLADELVRRGRGRGPLTGASALTQRAVQAATLGVPLSQYPPMTGPESPLLPYLPQRIPFTNIPAPYLPSPSSTREPR